VWRGIIGVALYVAARRHHRTLNNIGGEINLAVSSDGVACATLNVIGDAIISTGIGGEGEWHFDIIVAKASK